MLLRTWSGWGVDNRELLKKSITLLNIVDAFGTSRMVSACCIIFSPLSLAVTALFQIAAVFGRSNNVKLSRRIIALAPDFVHAVIRIGSLEIQKGTQ